MYIFNPSSRTKSSRNSDRDTRSVNNFELSGTLVADACFFRNGTVRFTLKHSFGNSRIPSLYTDIVMFSDSVPRQLLHKGQDVLVRGFRKPNRHTDRSGTKHEEINFIAVTVERF